MSLKPGHIQFHQWCEPPLAPGDYKVVVSQTVDLLRKDPFSSEFSFSVAGPRFSLSPEEIYCVYPPNGHTGDFANSLPHVVFTRRTLPWERNLHPGKPPAAEKTWMAILLFSASDFSDGKFPELKVRRVGDPNEKDDLLKPNEKDDLLKPNEKDVMGPDLRVPDSISKSGSPILAAYESKEDLCNTIDLPGTLFRQIAPKLEDIQYLAHVREVNTGDKETLSFLADGWFSVVLGNRFPEPEKPTDPPLAVENRAVLVSLEGMEKFLPGGSEDLTGKSVRLAVLANWSFHCRKAYSFKTSMEKIKAEGFKLPVPKKFLISEEPGAKVRTDLNAQQEYVCNGLNRGYVAVNHHTRSGEDTVSWYRGPLTPVEIGKKNYIFKPVPDGLLRYDYNNGLMDATYAAAAQLGRLLGLQDRSFAKALCAYRTKVTSQIRDSYRKEELMRALNAGEPPAENESQLLEFGLRVALEAKKSRTRTVEPQAKTEAERIEEDLKKEEIGRDPPPAVSQWLARRMLLYGVPFSYLVPDERLLPPGSMRFFCLDPGWLKCLLEGACSVGRSSTQEQVVDEFLRNRFLNFDLEKSLSVRQRPESEHGDPPTGVQLTKVNWPLTGFLLRSPLVAGWQGVEMRAWQSWDEKKQEGEQLEPLRIDRLTPDIMLCIFNGNVVRIEIQQPPEGMHFGAATEGANYIKTSLRRLNPADKAGDQVVGEKALTIPMRGTKRVVEVAELANTLEKLLKPKENQEPSEKPTSVPAMDKEKAFTSAEMGVQMTESPGKVFIEIPIRKKQRTS